MNKIQDHLKFNDVAYKEFNSEIKNRLDKFAQKLTEMGFKETIVSFPAEYVFNIIDETEKTYPDSNFPKDLVDSMFSIWIHLDA